MSLIIEISQDEKLFLELSACGNSDSSIETQIF